MADDNSSPLVSTSSLVEPDDDQRHYGGWVPKDTRLLHLWIHQEIVRVEADDQTCTGKHNGLDAVIQEFIQLIESDPIIYMNFNDMIAAVKPPPADAGSSETNGSEEGGGKKKRKIDSYRHLMLLLNDFIQHAPRYERLGETDVIGVPIYALLDPFMNTTAGATAFAHPRVNAQFKKMLNVWSRRLVAPESQCVLTEGKKGWLSSEAIAHLEEVAQVSKGHFADAFVCKPSKDHWGFKSWDDFFTRRFRDDTPQPPRPVHWRHDNTRVNAACESTVYRISRNVNRRDNFWIKGQPYSLQLMLDDHPLSTQFTGGTVFQAFLSPFNYHRWHSPVNGRIIDAYVVDGSYYASVPDDKGTGSLIRSQAFITSTAARALIFIECVNPDIGLMCFIGVGMAEVSSCELFVRKGEVVSKGTELGTFHFGGSSHCLIFGPDTELNFREIVKKDGFIKVNSEIAYVPDVWIS
ncbi:hypothetical protein ONZ45_g11488 [Pleurotus djamor]|nr:hypothetical protein ONZ45_g11488 [Pleurotus djamor]